MTRYVKGHQGPMLPAAPPRPAVATTRPTAPIGTKPKPTIPNFAVLNPLPQMPAPTGPMVPVRGGGMAPQSQAYFMKKGGTTKLHSITKSNKKSNW